MITERIVKFPYEEWMGEVFFGDNDLASLPYCVCYQYYVDESDCGEFGFFTENASYILSCVFGKEISLYTSHGVKKTERIDINGLYLYGDSLINNDLLNSYSGFSSIELKNKLRERKGMMPVAIVEKPCLYNIQVDDRFDVLKINELINTNADFFLSRFFMPEAGQSMLIFDLSVWNEINKCASVIGVDCMELNSIDELSEKQ
ncbi:hypothetical protein HQN64_23475 [Enterobacteriaceae bacterium BIT-l23]|uniref:hypothetical protein n=1 Tax=Jejubacter sp. L23 TaxID=3092086 RepID=UPI001584E6FD|nr:hypothetical protein [Enterobacteriaceae bacterium BIT-l23]